MGCVGTHQVKHTLEIAVTGKDVLSKCQLSSHSF